ncbi:PPE domain-containing protein [Saccharopolyspora pogona]|uniref:PPE domain-containing protein n=1 Tax=Saccharopolyspora pogona TaxID=333966 RepID=UPI001CC26319|nr:PPE domain-containing protein [Saccharopolyspora pogona]
MTQKTTGPDADFALTETQNWASRSHRELYEAVHAGNDPGRVGQLADEWNRLSRELAESATSMGERLRATEAGWEGEAADAARSAIQQLADWNHDAGTTAGALAERIAVQGRIMETARAEMPEPVGGGEELNAVAFVTYSTGNLEAFKQACVDLKAHRDRSDSAHQQAVQVMTWMEDQSRNIDGDTPKFTRPPDPIGNDEPVHRTKQILGERAKLEPKNVGRAPEAPDSTLPNSAPGDVVATQRLTATVPVEPPPGDVLATQRLTANVPLDPTPFQPPNPSGTGPMDAPTTSFPAPPLGGPASFDGPTQSLRPPAIPPIPPLGDYPPNSTTPQGINGVHPQGNLPPLGDDRQYQPRPFQGPDGPYPTGPRVNPGPGDPRGGWRGPTPPIPGTGGGPGGPVTPGTGPGGGSGPGGGPGFRGGPVGLPGAGGGSGVGPGGTSGVGSGGGSGTGRGPDGGFGGRGASAMPGQSGNAGAPGMGSMGGRRGQNEGQEKERTSKYVEGGPVVEVPGADLPPPVIGEGKRKKQQDQR